MKNNTFNFCPDCGSKSIKTINNARKWECPDCGFDLYCNVAAAVGLIITNSNDEVLFEIRAKDPKKGALDLPGGFCDPGESSEETAMRECFEETEVKPVSLKYLCSFPNNYEYRNILYKTCDLYFEAKLPEGCELKPQEGEVVSFTWRKFETQTDIDNAGLAFDSAKKALSFWLKKKTEK